MRPRTIVLAAALAVVAATPPARAEDAAVEAMREYLMFAEPQAGVILPQQIDRTVFEGALFIDARDAAQFAAGTIPGAVNIEWRETLDRIEEIPADRAVILFCNTGVLSAQAAFALRVAGRANVLVMQSGLEGWRRDAAFNP